MNQEQYVSALQSLIVTGTSTFKYIETNISQQFCGYKVKIEKENMASGDIINFFNVISRDITSVSILIDGTKFSEIKYNSETCVVYEPFTFGINTVACDNSTIELNVICKTEPIVYTYYTLIKDRNPYFRKTIQGDPCYLKGIFTKMYTGPTR